MASETEQGILQDCGSFTQMSFIFHNFNQFIYREKWMNSVYVSTKS